MQVERTRLYRVRDVAEHFDVSVATIYRAIESGQLTALKLGTGTGTFRVTGVAVLPTPRRACAPPSNPGSRVTARLTPPARRWPSVASQRWGSPGDGRVAGFAGVPDGTPAGES
jgi:excisionase family DNA binding protein